METIKTTLQGAVERIKKDGGRIKYGDSFGWIIARGDGVFIYENTGKIRGFDVDDFFEPWFYEPQHKSAFHECIGQYSSCEFGTKTPNGFRKEGWNAAIDKVKSVLYIWDDKTEEEIEKLKEP